MKTIALVPAAGFSSRMGRPKLAMPLGSTTVLGAVLQSLHAAGVEHALVVVGRHVPEVATIAARAGADVLALAAPTATMRETVQLGLDWIEERHHPLDDDAWLLVPADHPTLSADVVARLLEARGRQAPYSIWVPTYRGRRGHPTLLSWKHAHGIREFPSELGINAYVRQQIDETQEVAVADESVLGDLDTPADYARLQRQWAPDRSHG